MAAPTVQSGWLTKRGQQVKVGGCHGASWGWRLAPGTRASGLCWASPAHWRGPFAAGQSWRMRWATLNSDGVLRYYKIKEKPVDDTKMPKPAGEISVRCVAGVALHCGT